VSQSSSAMPMIAFIGVLISWLMLARNSLLAWLASSAAIFALRASPSAIFLSVIFSCETTTRTMPEDMNRVIFTRNHVVFPKKSLWYSTLYSFSSPAIIFTMPAAISPAALMPLPEAFL